MTKTGYSFASFDQ